MSTTIIIVSRWRCYATTIFCKSFLVRPILPSFSSSLSILFIYYYNCKFTYLSIYLFIDYLFRLISFILCLTISNIFTKSPFRSLSRVHVYLSVCLSVCLSVSVSVSVSLSLSLSLSLSISLSIYLSLPLFQR